MRVGHPGMAGGCLGPWASGAITKGRSHEHLSAHAAGDGWVAPHDQVERC